MNGNMMDAAFAALALAIALVTLPGTLYLLVLTLASLLPRRTAKGTGAAAAWPEATALPLALVVPAHNEAAGISRCVGNLRRIAQADGAATVVVVADNCTDSTAALARALGARVLERSDAGRRGKGYALDFAFRTLQPEGFFAYVIVDADTVADANLLTTVRERLAAGAVAVQVRYGVLDASRSPRTRLAELALCAFNGIRPRGRAALGLSAGILGNGFALRSAVLEAVPYTATSVVEDLEYHLRLLQQGVRVDFAGETAVRGEMPVAGAGQRTQRARWEGGRLRMLREHGARLFRRVLGGELRCLDPLLDLALLPLGYHALLLAALCLVPQPWARAAGAAGLAILGLHVAVAARFGGFSLAGFFGTLLQVPRYLLWKIVVAKAVVSASRRSMGWVRTERNHRR